MVDYKSVKIAIHHSPGSFSERWIAYCEEKHIPYKIVNAYDSDIIKQVTDCTAFMWHHHHTNYKDALFAKQLLYSLQIAGKKVFPDFDAQFFAAAEHAVTHYSPEFAGLDLYSAGKLRA